jgi:hypothetical protein
MFKSNLYLQVDLGLMVIACQKRQLIQSTGTNRLYSLFLRRGSTKFFVFYGMFEMSFGIDNLKIFFSAIS